MTDPANIRPRRSFLFVPGTNPDMFPKALAAAPDIICVDLEDAVAPQHKDDARAKTLTLFDDLAGLEREATRSAKLGMTGKGAIHPKQLAVITRLFTPDERQIDQARKITKAFEEADSGLVVVDGKLIEKPVLRSIAFWRSPSGSTAEGERDHE